MANTPLKKQFPNNMRLLRIMSGLTQKQLGQKINHSQNTISNWEVGRMSPDVNTLYDLCTIFDVDANEMLGYTECKKITTFEMKQQEITAEIELLNNEQRSIEKKKQEAILRLARYQQEIAQLFNDKNKQ